MVNNAAMSVGVQIPLQDPSFNFFVYTASLGIHGALVPGHPHSQMFPMEAVPFYFPKQQCTRDPFSPHSHQHLLFSVFCLFVCFIEVLQIGVRWRHRYLLLVNTSLSFAYESQVTNSSIR